MRKNIYWLLLIVTVLTIAFFVGRAVWFCVHLQFFPPAEPPLPESEGPDFSSGLSLFIAALAGLVGGCILYFFDSDGQQGQDGGAEK